jgi:hypothetical protein
MTQITAKETAVRLVKGRDLPGAAGHSGDKKRIVVLGGGFIDVSAAAKLLGVHRSWVSIAGIGTERRSRFGAENTLLDHRVDAPVAVHDLGDAEVHGDRHQRDCLVFAELLCGHEEVAHLAECVAQSKVNR